MGEPTDEYRAANFRNWESRVPVHIGPKGYDLAAFVADPAHLSGVVRVDADRLGDLSGLDVLHLQCHIGTDTLSLARLGAASITGYDFAPSALEVARDLASRCNTKAEFVEGEVYDALALLGEHRFDVVYTGTGALNWLPDIAGWARVVAGLLRPGGRVFVRDAHPMLYAIHADQAGDGLAVAYPYFEQPSPQRWEAHTSYAGDGTPLTAPLMYEWNHGLGEVVTAVLGAGFVLDALVEHMSCEWQALPMMVCTADKHWVLPDRPERLPLMFTLEAHRPWSKT